VFAADAAYCTAQDLGEDEISPVPTLSEWGLITLSSILGLIRFKVM